MANQLTLTNAGQSALTNALTTGNPLRVSFLAVGSSDGSALTTNSTRLGAELLRRPLDKQTASGTQIIFEAVISEDQGPFTLKEVGLYDNSNTLIAYGSLPSVYKPTVIDGFGVALRIKATLAFTSNPNAATVVVGTADTGIYYTPNGTRVRLAINDDMTITPTPF
ncbi:MAG: phage tail protein [Chthoniobacteraceae bacterium]